MKRARLSQGGIALLLALGAVSLGACATYHNQLSRAQHTFEGNEHERTLALLKDLEPDFTRLTMPEQAHYAYLRGMTDYRVGYRVDARHWLSLAKALDESSPGVLPTDWKTRGNEALDELNGVVFNAGIAGLATSKRPGEDDASATQSGKKPDAK